MDSPLTEPFPPLQRRHDREITNPAIQLFGLRFFADQTVPELLVEFLLVASSPKRIGGTHLEPAEQIWPGAPELLQWPAGRPLEYAPKARLNLKLFAFLGASNLETRHETHRAQYRYLIEQLGASDRLVVSGSVSSREALEALENLFLGFQGIGAERTWCSQSFVPVTRALIAGESIWRAKSAKSESLGDWETAVGLFSHDQRIVLARGGELLYLQVCNALRQPAGLIREWCQHAGVRLTDSEKDPEQLREGLEEALKVVLDEQCPKAVGQLASFIDCGVDDDTSAATDNDRQGPRYMSCGWCPAGSWPEGLLFAVELLRICRATVDPIERLELMELACAMQLLRSLCAQSARYVDWTCSRADAAGALRFAWTISDPEGQHDVAKQVSRRSVNAVQRMIYEALRHPCILSDVERQRKAQEAQGRRWTDPYGEADRRYGHKLFLSVAKRIGLVVPKRGAGARFVLNDRLLRFLVMALIRPGQRVTYDDFKQRMFAHYGMAVDDARIGVACQWAGTRPLTTLGGDADAWLIEMLDAAGVFRRLSDACSLVVNPFGAGEASP